MQIGHNGSKMQVLKIKRHDCGFSHTLQTSFKLKSEKAALSQQYKFALSIIEYSHYDAKN